ncbi:MAG: RDD family protein [Planctomycetota bacterium]|jgi:uncharacterized RDD family membrane protein YckC
MNAQKCTSCGQEFQEWVEFCPHCAQAMAGYSRPAGFWIRVGAAIIDWLIFIPLGALAIWNMWSLKSMVVLILTSVVGLIYKPFMESYFGATVGKMSCGIKVIDDSGNKLSLFGAYFRFFPFLIQQGINLAGQLIVFSSSQYQSASSLQELMQAQQANFLGPIGSIVGVLVLIDCIVVAFTFRKRALHDMLAECYCVYKQTQELRTEPSGTEG